MIDLQKSITKHSQTATGGKLRDLLFKIWDNPEFVLGVLIGLESDAHKQIMIDEIEGGLTDTDDILYMMLDIRKGFYKKDDK